MSLEERLLKEADDLLDAMGKDFERPAVITEQSSITRVELRGRGWLPFLVIGGLLLVWSLVSVTAALADGASFSGAVRENVSIFFLAGGVLAVSAFAASVRHALLISPSELAITHGVFSLRRVTRIPMSAVQAVRVGAFQFANWDRYVAVETQRRTTRVAWGLSEEKCEQVARAIRAQAKQVA